LFKTCSTYEKWQQQGSCIVEIRKLHIYDIPGEDYKALANFLFEYCSRLEGVQAVPINWAGIVASCFLKSATWASKVEANTISKQA